MNCLNDFRQIGNWKFDDYRKAHESDVAWLTTTIKEMKKKNKTIVVLTHHCPINTNDAAPETQDYRHFEIELGIGCSDLSHLFDSVSTWCFGHTHWNIDVKVNKTRVVSNQVCYPQDPYFYENGCVYYDPEMVIKI